MIRRKGNKKRVGATQRDNTMVADIHVAWRCRHADPYVVLREDVQ